MQVKTGTEGLASERPASPEKVEFGQNTAQAKPEVGLLPMWIPLAYSQALPQPEVAEALCSNFTPALTTSSHDTPSVVAADDPYLNTPTGAEDISGVSSSFMFPSRSFEVEVCVTTFLEQLSVLMR